MRRKAKKKTPAQKTNAVKRKARAAVRERELKALLELEGPALWAKRNELIAFFRTTADHVVRGNVGLKLRQMIEERRTWLARFEATAFSTGRQPNQLKKNRFDIENLSIKLVTALEKNRGVRTNATKVIAKQITRLQGENRAILSRKFKK